MVLNNNIDHEKHIKYACTHFRAFLVILYLIKVSPPIITIVTFEEKASEANHVDTAWRLSMKTRHAMEG